jgi:hypothetical protein
MDAHEFYRIRAEDFARSFESLRSVEWRVAFQAYAGYGAIALGYGSLRSAEPLSVGIAIGTILATLVLALVTLYLSLRIQERLHQTRRLQNACLEELERLIFGVAGTSALRVPPEAGGSGFWFVSHQPPIHRRWYAFAAQGIVSGCFALGIIAYVVLTTLSHN